jgi:hypothetical protein
MLGRTYYANPVQNRRAVATGSISRKRCADFRETLNKASKRSSFTKASTDRSTRSLPLTGSVPDVIRSFGPANLVPNVDPVATRFLICTGNFSLDLRFASHGIIMDGRCTIVALGLLSEDGLI